ncbi:MAG TPA: hypothetical protein VLL08_33075 [Kineosporiaceae bacterium]|nr:hypothetical protein [Kineosporiaceae bacterium]
MTESSMKPAPVHGVRSRPHRRMLRVATCASAIGLVFAGAPAAHAADDEWYDPSALETSCTESVDGLGRADDCWFEPSSKENFTGNIARVSGDTYNCTDINASKSISWSQSTSETNSISVSVGVEAKLSLIYSVSINLEYGHSWTTTNTVTATDTAPVPAKSVGWIERGEAMQRVTGRMVHTYPKRRHGHYIWYTYPTLTNADPQAYDYDTIIFRSRPMTSDEASTLCGTTAAALDSVEPSKPTTKVLQQAKQTSTFNTLSSAVAGQGLRRNPPEDRHQLIGS